VIKFVFFCYCSLIWEKENLSYPCNGKQVVETCPAGCEQGLYQNICKLREQRTIEEVLLQESMKQLDGMSTLDIYTISRQCLLKLK
jgi:S-ribosylhomocysteine lyase LuxS involved in autoinducer biosynthesis